MSTLSIIAVGVSWWNQATLRALLAQSGAHVGFHDDFIDGLAAARKTGADLVAWASKVTSAHGWRLGTEF